ncbi:MAG TPA: hypothetical protein VIM12_04055 [Noviherbaspirillum sp.]|jgi:hypothetical protein|uniref:hypothetical protein n=1 Tax=Noviherbaspirillum sp. TaxID=1926288 RepID=UPI002F941A1F
MKRLPLTLSCASIVLAACASTPPAERAAVVAPEQATPASAPARGTAPGNVVSIRDAAGQVTIEKVAFRAGASSATVEKLAKGAGCSGGQGAGLVTEKGPVEVYRMHCDDGRVFLARCELRQCRPMR